MTNQIIKKYTENEVEQNSSATSNINTKYTINSRSRRISHTVISFISQMERENDVSKLLDV